MFKAFMLVSIGGFFGSAARYGVKLAADKYLPSSFPYATLFINLAGSLLIGLLFGMLQRNQVGDATWLIMATGFCGAFTTFSTFALENNNLMSDNQPLTALVYTLFSLVLGLLLCRLGIYLTR